MAFKIGFAAEQPQEQREAASTSPQRTATPRRSVVQVMFPNRGARLAYYNDQFDLHPGDIVFVDGKQGGQRGRVVEVNYNFKIRMSDYRRVVAVADTEVHGRFYMAGSHFVTFDPAALPRSKVETWYMAPENPDEYVSGCDDTGFLLEDLKGFQVNEAVAERGRKYYLENRVAYLSIDGANGYAIVEGGSPYELEFTYKNGEVSKLTCSCICNYNCKHEVAVILQLIETLELIDKNYAAKYQDYFAAVNKSVFFNVAVDGKNAGSFTL
ncbi:MAG: hypothetical protein LUD78_02680 [Clostridiales bacterium]|nr:hypothetical protein [Clostridiales bacterium]